MKTPKVHIDFKIIGKAMREHVRNKAMRYNSTIVYLENGRLIEEDPRSSRKTILKPGISE